MHWSSEQILALAPDPNTAKRGQGLATTRKWLSLETDGRAVWGKCKSSGTAHYETAIDLKGPAFKCNCPSRKFPCKHSIGLLLLSSTETDGFKISGEIPENVQKWLDKRDSKSSTPKKERTEEEIQKSEERKAKTYRARIDTMKSGINDLENWLYDLIRVGIASVDQTTTGKQSNNSYRPDGNDIWNSISKRMVDAKLGGLGRRIRELSLIQGASTDWPMKLLTALSDIHLIIKGFKKIDQLPESIQNEILTLSGLNIKKEELTDLQGINDNWMVVGQFEGTNIDNAAVRRTWFLGQETGKFALVLEYDYMNSGFPFHWPKGRIFKGEMIYYPSISPLRAIMRNQEIVEQVVDGWGGCEDMQSFLDQYSKALGNNPWLEDFPVAFSNVYPKKKNGKLYLVDEKNNGIPVMNIGMSDWKIIALGGGKPIDVFGEWTGEILNPLSVVSDYRFVTIS